jgi:Secretion system C-terminal sorting domain
MCWRNPQVLSATALGMSFIAMSAQLNFTNQQYLYNLQKADSTYIAATPETQTFYNTANATTNSFRKMYDIDIAIKQGNAALAQTLNNAFVPNSNAESNTKTYNTLAIKLLNGQSLTAADLTSLFSVASACPHIDAMCVYDARTLYNKIMGDAGTAYYAFGDDCNPAGLYKQAPQQPLLSGSFEAIIYPNPTSGSFTIQQLSGSSQQLIIAIRDVVGRIVSLSKAQLVANITTVTTNLPPGSYLVNIANEHNESVVKKLVIQ